MAVLAKDRARASVVPGSAPSSRSSVGQPRRAPIRSHLPILDRPRMFRFLASSYSCSRVLSSSERPAWPRRLRALEAWWTFRFAARTCLSVAIDTSSFGLFVGGTRPADLDTSGLSGELPQLLADEEHPLGDRDPGHRRQDVDRPLQPAPR